jgi:hypothetical protein
VCPVADSRSSQLGFLYFLALLAHVLLPKWLARAQYHDLTARSNPLDLLSAPGDFGAGLSADRRLDGDLRTCEKRSLASSHASVGRHLGGCRVESAELTFPADSRVPKVTACCSGALFREPTIVACSEMTQQMRCWTSPKSVNPNPSFVLQAPRTEK